MKLGTQTNSMTNHILASGTRGQPDPTIGMGATVLGWTDRHAATVTAIGMWRRSTLIEVRNDHATRTDNNGASECQTYEYAPNQYGTRRLFWWDEKRGVWREVYEGDEGKRMLAKFGSGKGLWIGERRNYHDYSF